MSLPVSAGRLAAITDFLGWRRAVERLLTDLDSRVGGNDAGAVVAWPGGDMPAGLLPADGTVLLREDYPRLFTAISTTYNTGGETADQFRLPNYSTPPQNGVWAIRT